MKIKLSDAWLFAAIQMLVSWGLAAVGYTTVGTVIDKTCTIIFLMLALTIVARPNRREG
jgi:hypothetical protein